MVLCRWILCQTNEYWSATKIKSVFYALHDFPANAYLVFRNVLNQTMLKNS
jgi:hypothetical protein